MRLRSASAKPLIGKRFDRGALVGLLTAAVAFAVWGWLQAHPQHNPWAPLNLNDPQGWTTERKLMALRGDSEQCRAVLARSEVEFTALDAQGEGACRRNDRTVVDNLSLAPNNPPATCAVGTALYLWLRDVVRPAAQSRFGSPLARVEHLGAYSCRRLYGRDDGPWSAHATGNAIDIAGFVLEDGTRISVVRDWDGDGEKAAFLRDVRDGACPLYSTVLSPDYNAAHRDHFHFDMSDRWSSLCR